MMEVEVTPNCSTLVMGGVTSRTLQKPPLTGVLYNCHRSVTPPLCTATFIIMIHSLPFLETIIIIGAIVQTLYHTVHFTRVID